MPLLDHSPPLEDHQRVRVLWDKFERWAQSQRKLLERRKADITYKQNAKKKLSSRERNHADYDEITNQELETAVEEHTNMLLNEWHKRMEDERLGPDAWGIRTVEEAERIARLFQTENAIDRVPPPFQNVYTQPQSAPAYHPAPPMISAARQANFSSSTMSSRFVDPRSLSTDDDEAYDAEESFQFTTDESENDYWMPSNFRGPHSKSSTHSSQNVSPDNLSSSGSSAYELLQLPPLSSSMYETYTQPPKRPPDTDRKGKARARGPAYVGPHLLSPEESSDEDDFTMFRMQTRIDKIWEFHLAAARADVELAIAIQNERMSEDSSWDDSEYETRISDHEKRLEELRNLKEKERQELVFAERKKRQQEINKRSALREHAWDPRATNAHSQSDWESLFQTNRPVHFDAEKRTFALGSTSSPDEAQTKGRLRSESHVEVSASVPSNHLGTVRTRKQSQPNAPSSSSGWKTKHIPSLPTAASVQAQAQTSSDSRSWFNRSLEVNDQSFDLEGTSAQSSTPVPPIPAGWGEKSWGEKPSAPSLLKKVLSDPASRKLSSLSSVVEPNSNELNVDPKSTTPFGPSKKPVKNLKGRQPGLGYFDHDAGAESPTMPTVNTNARGFAGMVSSRDILQLRHTHLHTDDEISSTPRPGMASAFDSTSWKTNDQDMLSRKGKLPVRHLQFDDDEGWGNIHALADKAVEEMIPQEDPEWGMMVHKQGMDVSHPQQMREGSTWSRGNPATKQSPPGSELSPWQHQQKMKSRVQPSAFTERIQPVSTFGNVPKAEDVEEDFWAAARAKLNAGANQSRPAEHHSVPEETPWQRMERLKAETSLAGAASSNVNPLDQPPTKGLHSSKPSWSGVSDLEHSIADMAHQQPSVSAQSSNKYWTPNGSTNTSRTWKNNGQSTAKHSMTMPGGYTSDVQQEYDHFGLANVGSSRGNNSLRMQSSYTKHPTVEEEPDEDGPGGRDAQVGALPYNSRFILDVAVPKPIHPPEAYSDVIDYGEDFDDENDWGDSLTSAIPTPSTAPTSPPSDMTEEWMNKVTENLKNGKLEDMDFDFGSFGTDISNKTKPASASSGLPTKQSAWGAQKSGTAKLQSALQLEPTSSTAPPKAAPTSEPVLAPAPASAKTAAAPEKQDPAVKSGNQNQKGKKGKGKGRK
ncbi:hypothetical protein C0995_010900 [Termitomyces sp. Mi166|nr:hypothetical protein C0995_010900 [Termitomyces sp. Mi166\